MPFLNYLELKKMKSKIISIVFNDSSVVSGASFDKFKKKLSIQFKSREEPYVFDNVPFSIFNKLDDAESKGVFINEEILGVYKNEAK